MRNVYSVKQVNAYIKNMFAQDFMLNRIYVKGEVSNCKYHTSGHIYFSLKDESGTMACIMFAGQRSGLGFRMQDGQQVIVLGNITTYERDGKYQLYAKEIILDGAGLLYERFEALKKELSEMGMFAQEYKQPIPHFAKKIGIVTAPTGAAIRDIINVASRRNPYVQLILYPALVQGEGAAESIVKGIEVLQEQDLDVIIVGRGGGSIEDLWAFNEECVARAIFHCPVPIISAVGHETDTTIADYAADLRAPTPSAAAELAVPDVYELKQKINNYQNRCRMSLKKQIELMRLRFEKCMKSRVFTDPMRRIRDLDVVLDSYVQRLENRVRNIQKDNQTKYVELVTKLDTLSPLKTLTRGYTLTEKDNKIVKSASELNSGDEVKLRFYDGEKVAKIN